MSKKHKGKHQPSREKPKVHKGDANFAEKKYWLLIGVILAVTFIVYIPSLKNGFTNWDDQVYVTENALLVSLSGENLKNIITDPVAGNYHPVTILSLALNYASSGLEPFSYHLVNLIFHLLNTALVFYFIFLLLEHNVIAALIAALLFALHPMHVESVAWIAERKDVLYVFFFLAGLITYLKYLDNQKLTLYLVTFFLFALSVLSKPAAVTFPVILFLVDYWKERKFEWKLVYEKIPFLAVAVLFGILTIKAQETEGIGDFEQYTILQKVMFASYGLVMYVIKFFIPFHMSTLHPYPSTENIPAIFLLAPVLVIGLFLAVFYSLKKTRIVVFGFLFYFFSVALVLQFVSVGRAIMAERYTYLAYVGLSIPLVWWLSRLYERAGLKNILLGGVIVYAIILGWLSFERNQVWKNAETLWSDVIAKYPDDWYAYVGRGNYYTDRQEFQKAFNDYNQAISLKQTVAAPYVARGNLYRRNRQYDDALKDLNKAVALAPNKPAGYNDRGSLYYDMKKDEFALADFQKALEINPKLFQTYNNLGSVYAREGDFEKGLEYFNKSISINPLFADSYLNRGILFSMTEKYQQAREDLNRYFSLKENPPADSYYWKGWNDYYLKDYNAAIHSFSEAIQRNPNVGDYFLMRSRSYSAAGKRNQALADAQKARSLGVRVEDSYLNSLVN